MKHRLLAAITIAATTAIPLLPAVGVAPANAVSCTVTNVLFPPEYPSYTRVALYQNATNPAAAVQCLEQRLNELGYGIGTPDGTYDSTSSAAVRLFQLSRGLYPDGVVSPIVGRQLGLRGPLPAGPSTPTVTIIGDSTSAALRWTDEANNNSARYDIMGTTYDLKWAVESCRRLVNASCSGRTGSYISGHIVPVSVLPLMRGSMSGQLGDAVVIMAGYDDYSIASTIDPIMAEASAQGVTKVFWLNYRLTSNYNAAYQGYYTQHNAALEAAKVRWPNLVVLDWNGYTKSQSYATQQAWFYTDGIHMRPAGATALAEYLKANLDASGLAACTPGEAQAGVPDPTTGDPATPPAALTGFTGIEPTRELDTRFVEYGGGDGMLGAGRTIEVDLSADLPADATAAVVNVTAVTPCSRGYITVFACGTRPDTSNVNYAAWRTTAGLAITPHTDGTICVYSSDATHLIVDLVGAFVPSGALFHPMQPTRWVDTRGNPAVGHHRWAAHRRIADRHSRGRCGWGGRRRHRRVGEPHVGAFPAAVRAAGLPGAVRHPAVHVHRQRAGRAGRRHHGAGHPRRRRWHLRAGLQRHARCDRGRVRLVRRQHGRRPRLPRPRGRAVAGHPARCPARRRRGRAGGGARHGGGQHRVGGLRRLRVRQRPAVRRRRGELVDQQRTRRDDGQRRRHRPRHGRRRLREPIAGRRPADGPGRGVRDRRPLTQVRAAAAGHPRPRTAPPPPAHRPALRHAPAGGPSPSPGRCGARGRW